MILLREAQDRDLDQMERLTQIPGFISLAGDREQLREKIERSTQSFLGKSRTLADSKYIFVAEDLSTKTVIGTSMITGQHGTEESPHYYFEVGSEKKFSESMNTGFIHGTLKLKYDTHGPTEIGGLVLDQDSRNHPDKIGRQLSLVRFQYLAMHPKQFGTQVIAELLPPLNKKGQSPLWEAIGRRFTNMDYWEADQLSQKNKEFLVSLFPTGKIYTTFLTAEAKNSIGKVGKDTEPVVHLLKRIGFKYKNQVDPFDGGPHYWAEVSQIKTVQQTRSGKVNWVEASNPSSAPWVSGLLTAENPKLGTFRAAQVLARVVAGTIEVQKGQAETLLQVKTGSDGCFTPVS